MRFTTPEMLRKDPSMQWFLMIPYLNELRFHQWENIISMPKPSSHYKFLQGMWHYTNGIAKLHQSNNTGAAKIHYQALKKIVAKGANKQNIKKFRFNQLRIAQELLAANISEQQKDYKAMQEHAKVAINIHQEIGTKELPMWFLSTRRTLARAYYRKQQYTAALAIVKEGLKHYPNTPWLLHDLAQIYQAIGDKKQALHNYQLFLDNWHYADVVFPNMLGVKSAKTSWKNTSKRLRHKIGIR